MTLNGVMAVIFFVISPNSVGSGAHCVKVVEGVVVRKFTFAILSPDEFLVAIYRLLNMTDCSSCWPNSTGNLLALMKLLLHELHRLCVR